MKAFLTKKNIAIVLAVLLVVAVVVLCITLRQKRVEDTDPTLTLACQSMDADGTCTEKRSLFKVRFPIPSGDRHRFICRLLGCCFYLLDRFWFIEFIRCVSNANVTELIDELLALS